MVSKFYRCSHVSWLESHPKYLGVSDLFAGSDILGCIRSALVVGSLAFQLLIWRRFSRALDTKVLPDSRYFPKFLEGLLRSCEATSREFYFLPYIVLVSRRRRFFHDYFLLYDRLFTADVVSSCSVRRRRKIAIIEEFVRRVLRFFYYQLTLSRSGFAKFRTRLVWIF